MHEILDEIILDKDNKLLLIKKYDKLNYVRGYSVESRRRDVWFFFFSVWFPSEISCEDEDEDGYGYLLFPTFQDAVVFASNIKLNYKSK